MFRLSFEVVDAVDCDELRPSYAPEAVAWVAERSSLHVGSVVLDLAAGTGQLSRRFEPLGVDIIAVEPAANMRVVLEERLPTIRVEEGTAEAIPCPDRSVDAVVVGNAFHHFDRDAAFVEIRRVMRPHGVLALFWAWQLEGEQRSIPGIEEIFELVEDHLAASEIVAAYRSWADVPPTEPGFGPFERREFRAMHVLPSARLADLYATTSDVASMPASARSELLARVRQLVADPPGNAPASRSDRRRSLRAS